jgi:hypothetical protein
MAGRFKRADVVIWKYANDTLSGLMLTHHVVIKLRYKHLEFQFWPDRIRMLKESDAERSRAACRTLSSA